jgi:hypothetical protein
MDDLERAVCASDAKVFCNDTQKIEAKVGEFCANIDKLS